MQNRQKSILNLTSSFYEDAIAGAAMAGKQADDKKDKEANGGKSLQNTDKKKMVKKAKTESVTEDISKAAGELKTEETKKKKINYDIRDRADESDA